MPGVVIATFNMHGGIDGWGQPYDAVAACKELDAGVLVLQENLRPEGGRSIAAEVAARLGYEVHETTLGPAFLYPALEGRKGFGPPPWSKQPVGLRLQGRIPHRRRRRRPRPGEAVRGDWGIAVLSRLPVLRVGDIDLGQLPRDPARRRVLLVEVDVGGSALTVAGTHMSHISHGSIAQYRRLARALPAPGTPAVVAGDMNLWGPPLEALLTGWYRAVRGRTWPAAQPLAQLDHLLVRRGTPVSDPAILRLGTSDHRAVRARLG